MSIGRLPLTIVTIVAALPLMASAPPGPTILYVEDDAPAAGDGLSWNTAYRFLQDAFANAGGITEIRVAQGRYQPDRDEANPTGTGSRTATLQLINGVSLRGGYAGLGEPDPDARDVSLYETVLSGDLAGDDGPDFANNGENSYHVVTGSGTDDTAFLDGFTIVAGNANGGCCQLDRGGGIYNINGSSTVAACTFSANTATNLGGGMYNDIGSNPMIIDCTFDGNSSGAGGGVFNSGADPSLSNCVFSGNDADFGGGMYNASADPAVSDCVFDGNSAGGGGGMYNFNNAPAVTNCVFSGNDADIPGGGGMYNDCASPTVINCTFVENSALANRGAGMHNSSSSPSVNDCAFSGGVLGVGMVNEFESNPSVTNCTFSGNEGGGMRNVDSSPTVSDCTFSGNTAINGGGMYNQDSSPTVTNCSFESNSAFLGGGMCNLTANPTVTGCTFHQNTGMAGGGMFNSDHSPTVTSCAFFGNTALDPFGFGGGGMFNFTANPVVTNCTFSGNTTILVGGAMFNGGSGGSSPTVTNCTFGGNSASDAGGIYNDFIAGGSLTLTNSILWGNIPNQIFDDGGLASVVSYSNVQGGVAGFGNIDVNPLFVDADGADDLTGTPDDNLRLLAGSPSIDAADNNADTDANTPDQQPLPSVDLDGNPRFLDDLNTTDTGNGDCPIVDMGAYERPTTCPWDLDCDGSVSTVDLLDLLAQWGTDPGGPPDFDGDGNVGTTDLLELLANWGPCP